MPTGPTYAVNCCVFGAIQAITRKRNETSNAIPLSTGPCDLGNPATRPAKEAGTVMPLWPAMALNISTVELTFSERKNTQATTMAKKVVT